MIRDENCTRCSLSAQCAPNEICIVPRIERRRILVVTRSPGTPRTLRAITDLLREAGIEENVAVTSAVKCRSEEDPKRSDIKACRHFLEQEIEAINPEWILVMGNEALYSVTNRSGVMKYRGKTLPVHSRQAFITVSPSIISRYPGMKGGLLADLRYFKAQVEGIATPDLPPVKQVMSMADLRLLCEALDQAKEVSFDIESTGFDEFLPDAKMISVAFTLQSVDDQISIWAVPLYHPESPFINVWEKVIKKISPHFNQIPKAIAHNGKFDCRWLRQFGCDRELTFDTMIAAFLLDENRPKGLKGLAQQLLGADPWDVDASKLLDTPIEDVLIYNGLDTYWTHGLYHLFRKELAEQPRLARIFVKILMPCSEIFTEIERQGVWIDQETLATSLEKVTTELAEIDHQLMEFVPLEHGFKEVNFRPSNFLRWLLFEHLQLPVIARGKQGPSVAEAVMIALKGKHPAIELLIERSRLEKILSGFLRPYTEMVDEDSRLHTTFKLTGTVTGRLSSGKPDQDQVVGRTKSRGVNLQQVPRDPFVRGLFGAPPGWAFIESDFSQIELRIAAYLAQEKHMLYLYSTGQDIHMATAMRMTGKPMAQVTKDERKKAKAVNFGFLYGMGATKFISTALLNYGVVVTEEEAQAFRSSFFEQFPMLRSWHQRQRNLARKYKRVQSPIGRIRHLPDIDSPNEAIAGEAQRQAINSPVQSFASDLALMGLVGLDQKFKQQGLKTFAVGTVHDAINFQAPIEELSVVMPLIKSTMENPPLERQFGVHLNVPIVADLKVGTRWGLASEVPNDIVFHTKELEEWLDDRALCG